MNSVIGCARGGRPFSIIGALVLGLSSVLVVWLALTAVTRPVHADTLCVKPGGGDGCMASINDALAIAQENDTIRVAAGIYTENIFISQTVTLQGGWNANFTVRDSNTFSTTIHPLDNTQSVVAIQGQFADPAAVVPTLDGFVISGGRADLGSNHGGGLQIRDSNALIISNTIRNNTAFLLGGGVWVQRGAPVLQDNQITNNRTVGLGQDAHGGGVQLENTQAMLLDNLIAGNVVSGTETYGGGIEVSGTGVGQVTLLRNLMISNTASVSAGNPGFGGAFALRSGQVFLQDGILISNTAVTGGGGIFIGGLGDCCNLAGKDNVIQANSANQGGGLFNDGQIASLHGGQVISNTAVTNGGGIFVNISGMISVTNSALIANLAGQNGGAIYNSGNFSVTNTTVSGNSATSMGGGIANLQQVNMVNATISNNSSSGGAGLFNASLVNTTNSLIALNIGDNCLGVLTSQGHNLEDGGTCALGQPTDMSNTLPAMNPLGENGGSTPTHALTSDSPAIDAGDNSVCSSTDQRGTQRPIDGDGDGLAVCDIGAYEYVPLLYLPILMR